MAIIFPGPIVYSGEKRSLTTGISAAQNIGPGYWDTDHNRTQQAVSLPVALQLSATTLQIGVEVTVKPPPGDDGVMPWLEFRMYLLKSTANIDWTNGFKTNNEDIVSLTYSNTGWENPDIYPEDPGDIAHQTARVEASSLADESLTLVVISQVGNDDTWHDDAQNPVYDYIYLYYPESNQHFEAFIGYDGPIVPYPKDVHSRYTHETVGSVLLVNSSAHAILGPAEYRSGNLFNDPPPFDVHAFQLISEDVPVPEPEPCGPRPPWPYKDPEMNAYAPPGGRIRRSRP